MAPWHLNPGPKKVTFRSERFSETKSEQPKVNVSHYSTCIVALSIGRL